MRFDAKARVEANFFWDRYYRCTFICESCMACQPFANAMPELNYKDFRPEAPHHLTEISHETYVATCSEPSPWLQVEGWRLGTAFRDPMHTFYLGVFKDLIPSLLGNFLEHSCLEPLNGSREEQLRVLSLGMHRVCRQHRFLSGKQQLLYMFPWYV